MQEALVLRGWEAYVGPAMVRQITACLDVSSLWVDFAAGSLRVRRLFLCFKLAFDTPFAPLARTQMQRAQGLLHVTQRVRIMFVRVTPSLEPL